MKYLLLAFSLTLAACSLILTPEDFNRCNRFCRDGHDGFGKVQHWLTTTVVCECMDGEVRSWQSGDDQ